MPFQHLIFFLFFFSVFCVGGLLLLLGWKLGRRPLMFTGGSAMAGVISCFVAGTILESQTDWNPHVARDDQIVGTWSGPGETLALQADHTFTYQSDEVNLGGTWSRRDWNLLLMTTSTHREMRVISYFGNLRVMTRPPDDPDLWDGNPGLILQE